jgi:Plasmid replication region DNA-binding N-term
LITYEMVRDVVQTLKAARLEPSRKRVRERLGEGSYETIGRYIDRARAELGFPAPVSVVEDDEISSFEEVEPPMADNSPDEPPGVGYTPPTPDAGEVERHLASLRTQTAIAAARSHLVGLCAALRCLEPALERIQPHLHQQYLTRLLADEPLSPATIVRPAWQEPMDTLTTASPTMLEAAEALLRLLEAPATASIQEAQHGPKPAA